MIGSGLEGSEGFVGISVFQSLLFWMIGSGGKTRVVLAASTKVSILVVLDDWFGGLEKTDQVSLWWFQSLLFWMIGSGLQAVRQASVTAEVSILVVLDDWFGVLKTSVRRPEVGWVSILVVLDDWFGERFGRRFGHCANVSILVVLDDWFGAGFKFAKGEK